MSFLIFLGKVDLLNLQHGRLYFKSCAICTTLDNGTGGPSNSQWTHLQIFLSQSECATYTFVDNCEYKK